MGPKGLRAESARAVTGRRCPHSGEGEDFLKCRPGFFFTKTAVTREQKVEKLLPTWEMNHLSEGYKQAVDQNWGRRAKIGLFGQIPRFWAQKRILFLVLTMAWPRPEKVVQRKSALFQNKYQSLKKFWVFFFSDKTHFWPKEHFSANIKTGVSP